MRITMTDVQLAGHCAHGARAWFRAHGLDFRSFLREGIEAEVLVEKGDALAKRVVDLKAKREAGRG
jgi:hypothetical protein